jgi:hypothetical protein
MPVYAIEHPRDQHKDDVILEDPHLTLAFESGWAVFRDDAGICYAIPAGQGAHIQRVDVQEPAPREE